MTKILIIEDEVNVLKPLQDYLVKDGFNIIAASSIQEGEVRMLDAPDLVLLDWMLPDGQGIHLLKKWREQNVRVPVILLTARTDLVDKVLGLELGADDYITKPFEPRELVARIRVRLRPKAQGTEVAQKIQIGDFSMDTTAHEAFYKKKPLELTKMEFNLLRIFLEHPNQVFSREELLEKVWGYDQYPTTRTVDTHILQLRQKTHSNMFETVHGVGYRFRLAKK